MYKAWVVIITCVSIVLVKAIFWFKYWEYLLSKCSPQVIISENGKYFTNEDAQNFVNSLNISGNSILKARPVQVDFLGYWYVQLNGV